MSRIEWPTTIFAARYGGIYENGEWIAVDCEPGELDPDALDDDLECSSWFEQLFDARVLIRTRPLRYGIGKTPDEALEALRDDEEAWP